MKITVNVVPVHGDSRKVDVDVRPEASLRDVLAAAKISPDKMQVSVDGNPVTDLDNMVSDGATVSLTEKARGS